MSSKNDLEELRCKIDKIDTDILNLLKERMEVSKNIGIIKKDLNINIHDRSREESVLENLYSKLKSISFESERNKDLIKEIWNSIFKFSRLNQI